MAINPLQGAARYNAAALRAPKPPESPIKPELQRPLTDFGNTLETAIKQVDQQQHLADDALVNLASGRKVDLHGTMIQMEKADIALRTMVSVRNKFLRAYEQIMNMTI
jgi:flagellar hook-basal body complex protein FliE